MLGQLSGISLLDVVGKLFARVIQDRLQEVAEDTLPESQCGFRKGRGCTDMMFVARQLVEKSIEHGSELHIVFVDLQKAYDSIPCAALWTVLDRLGVPPRLLLVVKSLHEGMIARIRVSGTLTDSISVSNGLRQGCTLAPTLFNIYFSAVVSHWCSQSSVPGVEILYRLGRKLVGDRTAKSRLNSVSVTESQFADDAALYTTSRQNMEIMSTSLWHVHPGGVSLSASEKLKVFRLAVRLTGLISFWKVAVVYWRWFHSLSILAG